MYLEKSGIGGRIENARLDLGMTQKELGKKLGVSQAAVCHWENSSCLPRFRLKSLAKVLRMSLKELKEGNKKEE